MSTRKGKNLEDRYLYKAKRLENGEWVQGYLIYSFTGVPIIVTEYDHILMLVTRYEVDPKTICQCTGLKDKNGKLIWENDIMVAHLDEDYPEDETYIRIMWRENGFCSIENGSEDITPIDKFDREHFEVCGNIFDNAELLESEG